MNKPIMMNRKIVYYQTGFFIMYFLDLLTTYLNGFGESNPVITAICKTFYCLIQWKVIGFFVILAVLFIITNKFQDTEKLTRYSRLLFFGFFVINGINILNYMLSKK